MAVEGLGKQNIIWAENTNESREVMANKILASDENATSINPSEDPLIFVGQDTRTYEMIRQIRPVFQNEEVDVMIKPVGT